jgi:hypothetical protein
VKKKVIGVFPNERVAEDTVSELRHKGFDGDISLLKPERKNPKDGSENFLADETINGDYHPMGGGNTVMGSSIGALAGLLVGAGAVLVPGVGPILAVGPISGILAGALTGGLAGALMDYGIPEERSRFYEGQVQAGKTLVILQTEEERINEAADILKNKGAEDVEVHGS